jgi:hypothetical protein
MITTFICIVIFVWLAVCAAKMIAKKNPMQRLHIEKEM